MADLEKQTLPASVKLQPISHSSLIDLHMSDHDPAENLWSIYVEEATKYDNALLDRWQSDMDILLIFTGLFSAVVTSFVLASLPTLQPDSEDLTVSLVAQISTQLLAVPNDTQAQISSPPQQETTFRVRSSALAANLLWLLSLFLGLFTALCATLVKQWARHYIDKVGRFGVSYERAMIRARMFEGLHKYGMPAVVVAIPALLHASLFLFLGGMCEFLAPINSVVANMTLVILVVWSTIYVIITVLPFLSETCPYRTPFSISKRQRGSLISLRSRRSTPNEVSVTKTCIPHLSFTFIGTRRIGNRSESPRRNEKRDHQALTWTLSTMNSPPQLQRFLQELPNFHCQYPFPLKRGRLPVGFEPFWKDVVRRVRGVLRDETFSTFSEVQGRTQACFDILWILVNSDTPWDVLRDILIVDSETVSLIRKFAGNPKNTHVRCTLKVLLMRELSHSDIPTSIQWAIELRALLLADQSWCSKLENADKYTPSQVLETAKFPCLIDCINMLTKISPLIMKATSFEHCLDAELDSSNADEPLRLMRTLRPILDGSRYPPPQCLVDDILEPLENWLVSSQTLVEGVELIQELHFLLLSYEEVFPGGGRTLSNLRRAIPGVPSSPSNST